MCDTARWKMVSLCSTCYNSDKSVENYCEFSRAQGGREGQDIWSEQSLKWGDGTSQPRQG